MWDILWCGSTEDLNTGRGPSLKSTVYRAMHCRNQWSALVGLPKVLVRFGLTKEFLRCSRMARKPSPAPPQTDRSARVFATPQAKIPDVSWQMEETARFKENAWAQTVCTEVRNGWANRPVNVLGLFLGLRWDVLRNTQHCHVNATTSPFLDPKKLQKTCNLLWFASLFFLPFLTCSNLPILAVKKKKKINISTHLRVIHHNVNDENQALGFWNSTFIWMEFAYKLRSNSPRIKLIFQCPFSWILSR
jgi:hypothetical protein